MRLYKIVFLFMMVCASQAIIAQGDGLPTGEVDVIDEFEARLIDAERFVVNPLLPPLDTNKRSMLYNLTSRALQVQYLPPKINPLRLSSPDLGAIYNGYVRLGAGFPQALYLDGAYDFMSEDSPINIGVDVFHNSANNNRNVENQKFANTMGKLSAAYYNDFGFKIDGNVGYSSDVVHFYGYNDLDDDFAGDLTYAEDDVKQRFNTFFVDARLGNTVPTVANIDYAANIEYYNLQDNYAARENGFIIGGAVTKWLQDKDAITVGLKLDFTNYQDTATQNLNNFFLQPSYTYHGDRFRVKIGMNLASHEDEFYFYPDIEAAANVVENVVTAFVGANGDLRKNNFQNLSDYSPFISSRVRVENSFVNKYYGGIKGDYQGFEYRVQASYEDIDNLALFTSNGDSIPRFNVQYDTASIITLSAEVNAPIFQNLDLRGSIANRIYSLDRNDKAWHLPSVTISGGATYRMMEGQLVLGADVFVENGVPVPTSDGSRNLNALLDINGRASYQFTDQISGFVRVNNILNNKRQRWRNYPTFGLNALMGVTAKF